MANLSNEMLLRWMIKDPSWCLLYHREQVKQLLPAMAKSHVLVVNIERRLMKQVADLVPEESSND